MKRVLLFALALVVAIGPVTNMAHAGYGPATEIPATLGDQQAP